MLICADANKMIDTIQVAMNAGLNYQIVRDMVFTHPSMTEAFNDLYSNEALFDNRPNLPKN
jgi:pyruvate/2-oxoglutarate dehydrogenase complex dihydrolipoamide dehydrogenase (E3) component